MPGRTQGARSLGDATVDTRTRIWFIEAEAEAEREAEWQAMLRRPDALPLPQRPPRTPFRRRAARLGRAIVATAAAPVRGLRGILGHGPAETERRTVEAPHP